MAAKPMGHAAEESWALGCCCNSRWPSVMVFVPELHLCGGGPCLTLIGHHQTSHVHLSHRDLDLPPKPPLQLVPSTLAPQTGHPKKHGRGGGTLKSMAKLVAHQHRGQRWWHPKAQAARGGW